MNLVLLLGASFFIGSIPFAYLIVKMRTGKDIRSLGSGNSGATNVFRTQGRNAGMLVLLCDFLKGMAAVMILAPLLSSGFDDPRANGFVIGMAAVLGHVFTPFLRFRGGKGVATSGGVALAVYPVPMIIALGVWAGVLFFSRYMSLASLASVYVFTVSCLFIIPDKIHSILALAVALFVTWTHRSNIQRLKEGSENKFTVNR
jgi:glycerol-3-phosphate acyltransferase PlsY